MEKYRDPPHICGSILPEVMVLPKVILYEYQPGRGGVYPQQFLKGFKGFSSVMVIRVTIRYRMSSYAAWLIVVGNFLKHCRLNVKRP